MYYNLTSQEFWCAVRVIEWLLSLATIFKMRESTPRNRFAGSGFKPVHAAVLEGYGSERCIKRRY